jgi:DNA-binding protein H-NS
MKTEDRIYIDFNELPLQAMGRVLEALQVAYREKQQLREELDRQAADLAAQYAALGIEKPSFLDANQASERQRKSPAPRYRSHKDPSLTWSGRGHVAGWLRREMEETGLPREAFLVQDQSS